MLNGKEYIIQPESTEEYEDLVFYESEPNFIYLCRLPIPREAQDGHPDEFIRFPVGRDTMMKIMNENCIDCKSVMDYFDDLWVNEIY